MCRQNNHIIKISIFLCIICFSVENLYCRIDKKNVIGANFALGDGLYTATNLDGAGNYNTKYYYSCGIDYSRMLSEHWDLCSGIGYTYNHMLVQPTEDGRFPTIKSNLKLVTIPVQLKYRFGNFFFLNGGLFFNVSSTQSSDKRNMLMGCGLGLGYEYEFNSGILLTLNPFVRLNGIATNFHFLQYGLSLGIGYKF